MKHWSAFILTILALLAIMIGLPGHALSLRKASVAATYTLSGRVYHGETGLEPPNSTPIEGVTVSLYCSNNQNEQGVLLRSTTTDASGWYGLEAYDTDYCEYFNLVERTPMNYVSNGASTVGGSVITADWIQYSVRTQSLAEQVLTGNKFWDQLAVFSGAVYEGNVGVDPPGSTPMQGVKVSLYCSKNASQQGDYLRSTITDAQGEYSLQVEATDACDYFNIIETDPAGYTSNGATTMGGSAITANWIEYQPPLDGVVLDANKFWDERLATATPTPTPTPMPTSTPTPTPTGLPPATSTPTPTATPTGSVPATSTPTPTLAPSTTPPSPPQCQELLENGDFEQVNLAPWESVGAVGLASGHSGVRGVWMGGGNNIRGELWQRVVLPAGVKPLWLRFWWSADGTVEQPYDTMEVIVQYGIDQADNIALYAAMAPLNTWRQAMLDLSKYGGKEIALTFLVQTDAQDPTTFHLDDVSLQACGGLRVYLPLFRK